MSNANDCKEDTKGEASLSMMSNFRKTQDTKAPFNADIL